MSPSSGRPPPHSSLEVVPGLVLATSELRWSFGPASGPGGQHVNRSNTRVEVRFDVAGSPSLSEEQRRILLERLGPEVRIVCQSERSQARNRAVALERLVTRLRRGLAVAPSRRPTRATRASQERRLRDKRHRAQTKRDRRLPSDE